MKPIIFLFTSFATDKMMARIQYYNEKSELADEVSKLRASINPLKRFVHRSDRIFFLSSTREITAVWTGPQKLSKAKKVHSNNKDYTLPKMLLPAV